MPELPDDVPDTLSQPISGGSDAKEHIGEQSPREEEAETARDSSDSEPELRLDLQMGAWLGFHDGDTPLMAKLAVHDPEEDIYIFVNRSGIKMRQISGAALRALVSRGLVDILQTTSNFREEVNDVRKKLDT